MVLLLAFVVLVWSDCAQKAGGEEGKALSISIRFKAGLCGGGRT